MDLEEQGSIQQLVEGGDRERMVVLLGTPTAGSTVMVALTLTEGDPSYAGPLAGVPLGLPVYHVLEESVKQTIPSEVYEREIGPMEFVLDAPAIVVTGAGAVASPRAAREARRAARAGASHASLGDGATSLLAGASAAPPNGGASSALLRFCYDGTPAGPGLPQGRGLPTIPTSARRVGR